MNKQEIMKRIVLISITLIIFYVIFTKIDFHLLVDALLGASLFYLSVALVLWIIIVNIRVKRWQIILRAIGYSIPYKECFMGVMGAMALAPLAPSKSNDFIKAYYLKDKVPITKSIGGVLAERVFDLFTLFSFSVIGMIFFKQYQSIYIVLFILFIIVVLFFVVRKQDYRILPIKDSWYDALENIIYSISVIIDNKNAFMNAMMQTLCIWFLSIVQIVLFFYALGVKVPLLFSIGVIPIAILIGLLPITLGGMGTRDAAIIFFFSEYAAASTLLGVGILFTIFRYLIPSLIGIPFMRKMMK